jgi:hypothetical protein
MQAPMGDRSKRGREAFFVSIRSARRQEGISRTLSSASHVCSDNDGSDLFSVRVCSCASTLRYESEVLYSVTVRPDSGHHMRETNLLY